MNVIAEKIRLPRRSRFNASPFFDAYVSRCRADVSALPPDSRILVSDDVFDDLLDLRAVNEGIDQEREKLFRKWQAVRQKGRAGYHRFINLDTFEKWKEESEILKKNATKSKFVNKRLPINLESGSNGESGFRFFVESLKPDNLYLLDEPENSLSAAWQMKLATVIEGMARFERCQFVIATHSPFLLAMKGAKILDLDTEGAPVRKWTELENVRLYRNFFAGHEKEFSAGGGCASAIPPPPSSPEGHTSPG